MTNTLTEQWREGTLPKGLYYTRSSSGHKGFSIHTGSESHMFSPYDKMANQTEEVLAPVPSYDEYNDLIQQNVNQESAIETYIERIKEFEEMFDSAVDALYEYIKMYGVERECSKFLEKYAERAK